MIVLVKFHRGFPWIHHLMLDLGQIWWQSWLPSYNLQTKLRKLKFNVLWLMSNRSSDFETCSSGLLQKVKQPGSSWEGRNGREGWGRAKWWFEMIEESGAMEGLQNEAIQQFHLRFCCSSVILNGAFGNAVTWKCWGVHILQPRVVWRWSPLSQLGYLRSVPIQSRSWLEVVLERCQMVVKKKCIFNSHVQSCCQKFLNFNNNLTSVHTKVKTEASKAKESFNLAGECLTIIVWKFAVFVRSCIQYWQCSSSASILAMQPNPFMAVRMVFWQGLNWLNHLFLKSFEVPALFFSQVVEITHLRVLCMKERNIKMILNDVH